eukprot:TRINITY_DN9366_c0_g9_i1.p1 TRINITY_DN9366_c0_g9~~TRINITY_DN9366_c0_g9_i1.p1  ORF type:complete len:413 (+),score=55.03 TRINITY_DN9366_c0_g9_i1:34-1272(+)
MGASLGNLSIIMDKNVSICLMVDYQYLYRLHKVDIYSPKVIREFISELADKVSKLLLAELNTLNVNPSAKLHNEKLKKKISSESTLIFSGLHLFHCATAARVRKGWEDVNFVLHKMDVDAWDCADCGNKNFVNQEVDRRAIATMSEIVLEGIYAIPKVDLFVIVGGNPDYEEIVKLCIKHCGAIFIAGFKEDALAITKEACVEFIDIAELSQKYLIKEPPFKGGKGNAQEFPNGLGVTIADTFSNSSFIQVLEKAGLAPNRYFENKDRHFLNHKFIRLFYSSKEVAAKAKQYVRIFFMQNRFRAEMCLILYPKCRNSSTSTPTVSHRAIPSVPINPIKLMNEPILKLNACCLCVKDIKAGDIYFPLPCEHWVHFACVFKDGPENPAPKTCKICNRVITAEDKNQLVEMLQNR